MMVVTLLLSITSMNKSPVNVLAVTTRRPPQSALNKIDVTAVIQYSGVGKKITSDESEEFWWTGKILEINSWWLLQIPLTMSVVPEELRIKAEVEEISGREGMLKNK